jgi:hypothetical protein
LVLKLFVVQIILGLFLVLLIGSIVYLMQRYLFVPLIILVWVLILWIITSFHEFVSPVLMVVQFSFELMVLHR